MPHLQDYRALLDNACAMLTAAREQRWDDIEALDRARGQLLPRMTSLDDALSREDLQMLEEMIQTVLDCDRQTGWLAQVRQQELRALLGSTDTSRKLAAAYQL